MSNELGAGQAGAARLAAKCAMGLVLSLMLTIAGILTSLHRTLPLIISSDRSVTAGTEQVLPIVACMLIGDGLNAVMAGVVRGCGRQATGGSLPLTPVDALPLMLHISTTCARGKLASEN